jgi:uncharacterized membrane protein
MKKYFLTGLILLLPLALTIAIVVFLVNLFTHPFMGLVDYIFSFSPALAQLADSIPGWTEIVKYGSQILILILLFGITILLGVFARWFFFKSLFNMGDYVIHRIPLVNKVYKTTQEIIKTLFTPNAQSFKQVVMVPFPSPGIYSIGLVSSDAPPVCKSAGKADLITVFIATTPNPTSGFLVLYPREQCIFLDMKTEDAVKYIISCGMIYGNS